MSCDVGCRHSSDLALVWLWYRLAAMAPIGPLAWEPPYAARAAQEMAKRQKKKKNLLCFCTSCVPSPFLFHHLKDLLDVLLFFYFYLIFCCFAISWATPVAYGGSQARGPIGAVATWPTPEPQQRGIRAASATYTTAHGNAGSLTR